MNSPERNCCRLVKQGYVVALDLHLVKKHRRHNKLAEKYRRQTKACKKVQEAQQGLLKSTGGSTRLVEKYRRHTKAC